MENTKLNFIEFLKDKRGLKIPLNIRVRYYKETLTEDEKWRLDLSDKLSYFPEYIRKTDLNYIGSLTLDGSDVERIPDNLRVSGFLYLGDAKKLKEIGNNVVVGYSLSLIDSSIEKIGSNLYVGSNLFLNGCKNLKHIGSNMYVSNGVTFTNSGITELPEKSRFGSVTW